MTLTGHSGRVSALAFDPRDAWLVTGSWDGDLRQWSLAALDLDPSALLAEAEAAWGLSLATLLATNSGDRYWLGGGEVAR